MKRQRDDNQLGEWESCGKYRMKITMRNQFLTSQFIIYKDRE